MMRLGLTWLGLLILLVVEVAAAASHAGWLAWIAAPLMILLVATVFMHAAAASALSRIFAVTGLFWATILLGLGSADYVFRRVSPAPALTTPYQPGADQAKLGRE